MTCKKHPRYRAIYRPKVNCFKCKLMWFVRCVRKALGLPVAQPKPRTKKEKVDNASAN